MVQRQDRNRCPLRFAQSRQQSAEDRPISSLYSLSGHRTRKTFLLSCSVLARSLTASHQLSTSRRVPSRLSHFTNKNSAQQSGRSLVSRFTRPAVALQANLLLQECCDLKTRERIEHRSSRNQALTQPCAQLRALSKTWRRAILLLHPANLPSSRRQHQHNKMLFHRRQSAT